jgi:hypothetical protein
VAAVPENPVLVEMVGLGQSATGLYWRHLLPLTPALDDV